MRTNSTLVVVIRIVSFILLCLYSVLVFGQADNISTDKSLPLRKFGAVVSEKNIKLQWSLTPGNNASTVIIQKGYGEEEFGAIAEYWVNMEGNFSTEFAWSDAIKTKKQAYYRLKIIQANGEVVYSSVLHFDNQKSGENLSATLSSR
jgi:hypothetical protein